MVGAVLLAPWMGTAAVYVESTNGDISSDRLNPTVFAVDPGANTISGTVVSGDRDYLTFTILPGYVFQSLTLDSYSGTGTLTKSFIGIQSGSTFTEPPTGTNVANLLGYTHFGPTGATGDILDDMGTGSGAQDFTAPLPAGDYTFWIQETGTQARDYTFTLNMVAVPEPSICAMLSLGVVGLARRVRKS
jgi:hypothetical protein